MSWLGRPIRRIAGAPRGSLFLTFDDGPEPESTPAILDVLDRHHVRATFFMVAERAKRNRDLVARVLRSGHAIGNHSMDHQYSNYFSGGRSLRAWIERAENTLQDLTSRPSVGFRPPAGIRTPPLARALDALKMPMILWDIRYYDAVWPVTSARLMRPLTSARNGAIVLLHDRQPIGRVRDFCRALDESLEESKNLNICFYEMAHHYRPGATILSSTAGNQHIAVPDHKVIQE